MAIDSKLLAQEMEEESLYEAPAIKAGVGAAAFIPEELQKGQKTSFLDATAVKLAGAGLAIAATWITFRDAVSRAFFKSMNKGDGGAFADLQNKRDSTINIIAAPARRGAPVPDAMNRVQKVVKEYDRSYRARRELLNIHSVFDEMKALKHHQWMEVIFATGAVASVAIGAILAIASGRDVARKQAAPERADDKNGPQR